MTKNILPVIIALFSLFQTHITIKASLSEEALHEYVDLGLPSGTLWATCNIGASKPQKSGLYFAWGETIGYQKGEHIFCSNYKWQGNGKGWHHFNKYTCEDKAYGCWYNEDGEYVGTIVDGKEYKNLIELLPEDDAATTLWGDEWCTPTIAQYEELLDTANTSLEWLKYKGVKGIMICSKRNGNHIFLPVSGMSDFVIRNTKTYGYYWTRSLCRTLSSSAFCLCFCSNRIFLSSTIRSDGQVIRPVRVKSYKHISTR